MKISNLPYYIATRVVRRLQSWLGLNTLGARAIVLNTSEQILLVKHTYEPYWHLPGGGVNKGESAKAAIIRELKEEAGLIVTMDEPLLFGIYYHIYIGVNDYPVIYIIKNYTSVPYQSREIEQVAWFHYDELPDMASPGTKRRLMEYFTKSVPSDMW